MTGIGPGAQGRGSQAKPGVQAPRQWAWKLIQQIPLIGQQAPFCRLQGLGTQRVPGPSQAPLHPTSTATMQVPSSLQQAPLGGGQFTGSQVDPYPIH